MAVKMVGDMEYSPALKGDSKEYQISVTNRAVTKIIFPLNFFKFNQKIRYVFMEHENDEFFLLNSYLIHP